MSQRRILVLIAVTMICSLCAFPAYAGMMQVNGQAVNVVQTPVDMKGTLMVPVRPVAEAFGTEVYWDPERKVVHLSKDRVLLRFQSNTREVGTNIGKVFILEKAPVLVNGTLLVPVHLIEAAFGAAAVWNDKDKIYNIKSRTGNSNPALDMENLAEGGYKLIPEYTKPRPSPDAAAARKYVTEQKLLEKITDVQIQYTRFIETGDRVTMVQGVDAAANQRVYWLQINPYTQEMEIAGTADPGKGITREQAMQAVLQKGILFSAIQSVFLAPDLLSGKINWYYKAAGMCYKIDFITGKLAEKWVEPTVLTNP